MSERPRCRRCGGSLVRDYGRLPPLCLMCGWTVPTRRERAARQVETYTHTRYKHDRPDRIIADGNGRIRRFG